VPHLTDTTYQASYELFDPADGAVLGTAAVDSDLTRSGDRITDHDWLDPHRSSVVGERLTAAGALSLEVEGQILELPMDDTSCEAGDVRVQVMEKIPRQ